MDITKEFEIRNKRLGKRKNRKKEYHLLEKILQNPFPIVISKEPMTHQLEAYGWAYFNLNSLHQKEPIDPKNLMSSVALVKKVMTRAYDFEVNGSKYLPDGYPEYVAGIRLAGTMFETEVGKSPSSLGIRDHRKLTYQQSKSILHLLRFNELDKHGNFWENKKQSL